MAAKRVLGAMGGWFAAAGLACGQAGPFNGGLPPSGPAMLPEGGGALLEAPPGAYGMPDMQGPGERMPRNLRRQGTARASGEEPRRGRPHEPPIRP